MRTPKSAKRASDRRAAWGASAFGLALVVSVLCAFAVEAHAQDAAMSTAATSSTSSSVEGDATQTPTPKELARARTLFQRGVDLASDGEYNAAAKRFREALAIHWAPAVEYNLASALYETGQYAEAFNRVQSVLRAESTPQGVRDRAKRLERTLQPYVARLTVVTGGDATDLVVRVDGEPVPPNELGAVRAVSPGKHVVVAERNGTIISQRDVQIPLRTAAIVDVSLIATQQAAAEATIAVDTSEPAPAPPPVDANDRDDRGTRKRRIWLGVAAAAVALGTGLTLALVLRDDGGSAQKPVMGDVQPGVLTWK